MIQDVSVFKRKKMKGKRIGYIRVSTVDQNTARQLEGMALDKTFVDHFTGKVLERPQLQLMMDYIREDDHVVVHSLDRLGRNNKDLLNLVDQILSKGVSIEFVKENIKLNSKSDPMTNLLLSVLGAISQFEVERNRERQLEGIAIAKREGRYKGRPKISNQKIESIKQALEAKRALRHKSKEEIAKELGISRFTLYKYEKELMQ